VCLDILKTAWTPAWTLQSVCRAIIALLSNPEADSPLNCDAGDSMHVRNIWFVILSFLHILKAFTGCADRMASVQFFNSFFFSD
jgi:ubiquitin-protein ligase